MNRRRSLPSTPIALLAIALAATPALAGCEKSAEQQRVEAMEAQRKADEVAAQARADAEKARTEAFAKVDEETGKANAKANEAMAKAEETAREGVAKANDQAQKGLARAGESIAKANETAQEKTASAKEKAAEVTNKAQAKAVQADLKASQTLIDERNAFRTSAEGRLDDLNRRIREFDTQVQRGEAKAKTNADFAVKDLKVRAESVRQDLRDLDDATSQTLGAVKVKIEQKLDDLKKRIDTAAH